MLHRGQPSHNKRLTLCRPFGGSGFSRLGRTAHSNHIFVALVLLRIALKGEFNVNEEWLLTGKGEIFNIKVKEHPGCSAFSTICQENIKMLSLM